MSQGFVNPQTITLPLPVSDGGTGVTTSTGTGSTVLSTSPTLTTPRIGQINDTNGNGSIKLEANASAVNYLKVTNQITGGPVMLSPDGTDTNTGFQMNTKGTGAFAMQSEATGNQLTFYAGTGYQRITNFNWADVSSNQTVTFPDRTGTFNIGLATGGIQAWVNFNGSGTVAIRASGNVTSITDNGTGDYTVNITTALTDANYSAVAICSFGASNNYSGSNVPYVSGPVALTTTTYRLQTGQGAVGSQSGNIIDCSYVSVIMVR